MKMSSRRVDSVLSLHWLSLLLLSCLRNSFADVGTVTSYSPPYLPTECYGIDASQFPTSNLFGAAGGGIWDNGAACGRQYLVRCISASVEDTCVEGETIQIRIVDFAETSTSRPLVDGTTIVLSDTAFQTIANQNYDSSINVEYQL
ncbi:hypothetical protein ACFE04_014944 [Oxalis oulophora]